MSELAEIKKLLKDGNLIIGTSETIKGLKSNKIKKVWLSSNVPEDVKNDIMHYAKLSNLEVSNLSIPNDELGVVCKKQFSVSVASMGEK